LLDAADFIATLEKRQGLKFGCPEEVALRMGFIDGNQFADLIESMPNCHYRDYLKKIQVDPVKFWELAR
jgi:glucose-1-phosphate thymidylyltransferase